MLRKLIKLLRLLPISAYRYGLSCGVAATIEHSQFLHNGEWETILDIGANKGQFTLAARHLVPQAHIFGFEPLPGPSASYQKLFSNDPMISFYQVAIGAKNSVETCHISAREDSSSLLPIGELQSANFPGTDEAGITDVPVRTLDAIALEIKGPALLKIDVQGYEMEVLLGAELVLDKIRDIYVELSFVELYTGQPLAHTVISWLHERGFDLMGVYNITMRDVGRPIQGDFWFRCIAGTVHQQEKLMVAAM